MSYLNNGYNVYTIVRHALEFVLAVYILVPPTVIASTLSVG
ncbi:hypothetical protein Wcon_01753 [Wolbachia endosymbiont of Cylisticus convexus]|nr:hypothetical protein Wcon_01753 [Wolbachia endosymbiont of Cylisticus convexus]